MDVKNTISRYLNDAIEIKLKLNKQGVYEQIWLPMYDDILSELKEIVDLIDDDEQEAYNMFTNLKISKFSSFSDYIKETNPKAAKMTFNTRSKTIVRQLICRHCASNQVIVRDGIYICKKCGAEIQNKANSQLVAKEVSDNTKHLTKQLNALSGRSNAPNTINKIMPYLKMWLLDRRWMYEFITWTKTMKDFKTNYEKLTEEEFPEDFFEQGEDVTKVLPEYSLYKLYTDTFFKMTEKTKQYNTLTSNMTRLNDDLIYDICNDYYQQHQSMPKIGVKHNYSVTGCEYEIGNYICNLCATTQLDLPIKERLKKLFNNDLVMPGLMFDYRNEYGSKSTHPKKFAYQQNYIFIIHNVYNIQTFDIIEEDKMFICKTMDNFNTFIKEQKHNRTGKHHNSCLWQLTLAQVLTLPYFRCYRDIINVLPIKPSNTTIQIKEAWSRYCVLHHEELKKYKTIVRAEIPKEKITVINPENEDVNVQNVINFISGSGSYWNSDNDTYLREKMNVSETKHEWTNNISYQRLMEIGMNTTEQRRSTTTIAEDEYNSNSSGYDSEVSEDEYSGYNNEYSSDYNNNEFKLNDIIDSDDESED